MSSAVPTDPPQAASTGSKKKGNKKKKNGKPADLQQVKDAEPIPNGEDEALAESPTPTKDENNAQTTPDESLLTRPLVTNGHAPENPSSNSATDPDTAEKLEAMTKEREALRLEVGQLRKELEGIQKTHADETAQFKAELQESNSAKEHAEEQYQSLLERVDKLKSTLSDRLKRDKEELEATKERVEELETQNEELTAAAQTSEDKTEELKSELQESNRELVSLRSRNNLSAQNWHKEKDELTRLVQTLKDELESTTATMGEWEVIAMEERSVKESLAEKATDFEEQVTSLTEALAAASTERYSLSQAVDNLQRALKEIQEARKKELREVVEMTEEQVSALKKLVQEADTRAKLAETEKKELSEELERTAPFEKEVKEKNLLIGKLRHEAIVLNDHLTKALRYLKKTKPEDNVDRHIVTNYLLHFLTLDRSDPKRFQILQVIAGFLNWTDEQREQAGLARPGASTTGLRLPASPFHRTPSSPALNTEFFSETPSTTKESLAELWAGFLERSADEGASGRSREDSTSSSTVPASSGRPDTRG